MFLFDALSSPSNSQLSTTFSLDLFQLTFLLPILRLCWRELDVMLRLLSPLLFL